MTFVKRIAGAAAIGAVLTAGMLTGARAAAIYTAIDLNPSGFTSSVAEGIGDGQQVGFAANGGPGQAILWTGTAASALNLNPSGLGLPFSSANGVANGQQVGSAFHSNDNLNHAILWTGTAASAVDLNTFLPAGFTDSEAGRIDENGDIVGLASGPATAGNNHAFLWEPVAAAVPGSARYPAGATAAITKIGVPGAPPPPLIRPPTASIIPDRSRQWSAEGETEKAAGGCPEFQVSHICRYAASRSRVNRAMSKRGMVDRFRVSFCRRPSSNPGSVASRSARVS